MAKKQTKKTKEVVDKNVSEEKVETKKVKEPKEEKSNNFKEDGTYVLDLNKEEDAVQEQKTEDVDVEESPVLSEEVGEKDEKKKKEVEEENVIEEVTDEEESKEATEQVEETTTVENVKEEIKENTPGMELPENIQKVVDFMGETGGTLEDYVRLNADYSKADDSSLLEEYYRQTKPHLSADERNFLMEDKFSYNEDVDEPTSVKRKKLAYKEAVAEARSHLEQMKGKYYDEIKMGSKLPPEQQKAIDFFNRYNKEQEEVKKLTLKQQAHFDNKTNEVFNNEFKGFEFKVGDKKYRYNIKDVAANKEAQSNVVNVFSKYIDKNSLLKDAGGYHKSLFAARNPDAIAKHFYDQGKADAINEINKSSKNINMDPRQVDSSTIETGGTKFKVVSGDDSSKLKLKLKNY